MNAKATLLLLDMYIKRFAKKKLKRDDISMLSSHRFLAGTGFTVWSLHDSHGDGSAPGPL